MNVNKINFIVSSCKYFQPSQVEKFHLSMIYYYVLYLLASYHLLSSILSHAVTLHHIVSTYIAGHQAYTRCACPNT